MKYIKNFLKTIAVKTIIGKRYFARRRIYDLVDRYMLLPEEIREGEQNPVARAVLVEQQVKKYPKRGNEQKKRADWLIYHSPHNGDSQNLEFIRTDMLFSYFAYGFSPGEFLAYNLETKSSSERTKYVSDRDSVRYAYRMNDVETVDIFMDKRKTYTRFKQYYKRDAIAITKKTDYGEYCNFIKKHPVFVEKDARESCGRGIELVDIKARGGGREVFVSYVEKGNVLLEEKIVQSTILSKINPSTVNTVRCFTLLTRHGVIIPWCFGKFGRKDCFVDNAAAGGLLVGIDVHTGMALAGSCCDEFGQKYDRHPDTGIELTGFQYPDWECMLHICKEMAQKIPAAKWIGWDMAHTPAGWVVVEGNSVPEVIGPQSTWQQGIRKQLDIYLEEVDLIF